MKANHPNVISTDLIIIGWIFCTIFTVIGVLNVFLVNAIPGIFYFLISTIYYPETDIYLKKKIGFSLPYILKIIIGVIALWGTLAVDNLAELFGL